MLEIFNLLQSSSCLLDELVRAAEIPAFLASHEVSFLCFNDDHVHRSLQSVVVVLRIPCLYEHDDVIL